MPPLSPLVHTEHVDNFVGLSQRESVAQYAAERVSDALVEARRPVHPVTCSSGGGRHWAGSSTRRRSASPGVLAPPYCHASSPGWASKDEISSLVGHFMFRALVRRELLAFFSAPRRRLWVPVIQEHIFLAHCDLWAPWCPEVSLFDSSPRSAVVAALVPRW